MINRKILSIFIVISVMFTSGCWNYREISKLSIVAGVAVDMEGEKYKLTVEIAGPKGGQEGGSETLIYEASEKTIFKTVRRLISETGQKTYWSHTKVIIVSQQIAEKGMGDVLDFFYRDSETRRDMLVLVSKAHTASEILKDNNNKKVLISFKLDSAIRSQKSLARFPLTELRDVVENFKSEQSSTIIPVILKDNDTGKNDNIPDVEGSAVLKKDKVVGYLNGDETKMAILLSNKLKGGIYAVKNISNTGSDVSLEIYKSKTKRIASAINNELKMQVSVKIDTAIGEISGDLDFKDEKVFSGIKEESENRLIKDLTAILNKVQKEYKADIFGFGEVVERQQKKLWKKIKSSWDEEFSVLPVEINVNIVIRASGLTTKPTKEGE